ncbi:MAG: DUF948 domain-containing protein [Actinomycetota bacterium]|nr:DUF948 domain-containing protein [Actinomycetota bacterium]
MSWYLVLQVFVTIGLLALIGSMIYVLIQLRRTLSTLDETLRNVNRELPSILMKLQLTLDGVNSELGRVEDIVSSFHEVSNKVQTTTSLVQRAVASPVIRLVGLAAGARTTLANLVGRKDGS